MSMIETVRSVIEDGDFVKRLLSYDNVCQVDWRVFKDPIAEIATFVFDMVMSDGRPAVATGLVGANPGIHGNKPVKDLAADAINMALEKFDEFIEREYRGAPV